MIRVFVGSDERSAVPEAVLEHSIRANCSEPVDITFMRADDEGMWSGWKACPDSAKGDTWWTRFSGFRFSVPEACDFEGWAIYMDSDMMVHRDLAEVCPPKKWRPWWAVSDHRLCFSVIHCEAFADSRGERVPWWPSLDEMRDAGKPLSYYRAFLNEQRFIDPTLPPEWNSFDRYLPGKTAVTHFTSVHTQPWRPWPDRIDYREHPDPGAVSEFWRLAKEAGCATPS